MDVPLVRKYTIEHCEGSRYKLRLGPNVPNSEVFPIIMATTKGVYALVCIILGGIIITTFNQHKWRVLKALVSEYRSLRVQDWEIDLLALLHFESRVKLPDYMFEKEGKQSEFEFEVVQEHCFMAKELCEGIPNVAFGKVID